MFENSRIKVERARNHIDELDQLVIAHLEQHPTEVDFGQKPDGSYYLNVGAKTLPLIASAILGDAIHNLRAALDLLAVEMIEIAGGNGKDAYFPFAKSAEHLEEMIAQKKFAQAGGEAVAMLRRLAPYPGGNDDLRALHDLDIRDKHRAIIPTNAHIQTPAIEPDTINFETGKMTMRLVKGSEPDVRRVFPADGPLAGEEIEPTLRRLADVVEAVITDFTPR